MAISLQEANAYFDKRLNTEAWENADDSTKTKALAQAEKQLEPYRGRVDVNRFLYAVCEQALWLLQGDRRAELQQAGVQGFSAGSMSEQFNTKGRPADIAPGGWSYLRGTGIKAGHLR